MFPCKMREDLKTKIEDRKRKGDHNVAHVKTKFNHLLQLFAGASKNSLRSLFQVMIATVHESFPFSQLCAGSALGTCKLVLFQVSGPVHTRRRASRQLRTHATSNFFFLPLERKMWSGREMSKRVTGWHLFDFVERRKMKGRAVRWSLSV